MKLISLVPRGANQVTALFKGKDVVEMQGVAKLDSEGYLTSVVYLVEQGDSQGDIASKEVVKGYCHGFIANMEGSGIDVMHDCKPVGTDRAQVCEIFIVQKSDTRFHGMKCTDTGDAIDATDAWATVIKIHDPVLKAPYASGEWVGVSMFGSAFTEPVHKTITTPREEKPDMDETKMAALLKLFGEDLAEKLVTGIAKAMKPEEKKIEKIEPVKIPFEGNPLNTEDLAKHSDKVMQASCDLSTEDGLAKWSAYVAKKEDSKLSESELLQKQIAALTVRLDKADKASNTDGGDGNTSVVGKSIADKLAAGRKRAAELKKAGVL